MTVKEEIDKNFFKMVGMGSNAYSLAIVEYIEKLEERVRALEELNKKEEGSDV